METGLGVGLAAIGAGLAIGLAAIGTGLAGAHRISRCGRDSRETGSAWDHYPAGCYPRDHGNSWIRDRCLDSVVGLIDEPACHSRGNT